MFDERCGDCLYCKYDNVSGCHYCSLDGYDTYLDSPACYWFDWDW